MAIKKLMTIGTDLQDLKDHCTKRANEQESKGGYSSARTYEEIADRLKAIIKKYESLS